MYLENNNYIKFNTKSGNSYLFCPETCTVFHSEVLNDKKRLKNLKTTINLFEEKETEYTLSKSLKKDELKEYILKYGLGELLLEVTNMCNLRCKYCIFSGQYANQRNHDFKNMTWDIAKESIDIYMDLINEGKKYNPNRIPVIGFYGGEPLINFSLIKKSVEYIKSIYNDEIMFTVTTNGTLLTDEIIDFLVEEKFNVIFSVDGPEEIHDKNRLYANGKNTFKDVINNINKYTKKSNGFAFINSVYDYRTDLKRVLDFWENQSNLILLSISPVNPNDTDYYNQFDKETLDKFIEVNKELELEFLKLISKENPSEKEKKKLNFLSVYIGRPCSSIFIREILSKKNNKIVKQTGSCVPGDKMFFDVDGNLYPCEKINRGFVIGNNKVGLNYNTIMNYLIEYERKITSSCGSCKVKNVCSMCYISFFKKDSFEKDIESCNRMTNNYIDHLSLAYTCMEQNTSWFDEFNSEYYSKIRELAVTLK